jgi:polyhydroxyalkanoate synthase subunit PhaC
MKRVVDLLKGFVAGGQRTVGVSPHDAVFSENKWRLLRYRSKVKSLHPTPVLMVPSLINRHYVLDLLPGRSVIEFLVEQGHDVFAIDWGTPGDEDRFLTFDTFCDRYLGRAIRRTTAIAGAERVNLLGYCLGGTLTAIHAALHPEPIASLVALAAPIRFHNDSLLSIWTRTRTFDVGAVIEAFGNVPWPLMQASFHLLKPTLNLQKAVQLLDRAEDEDFMEGFLAVETWSNDNVSFPGLAYEKYIEELYRKDNLIKGELYISGRRVDLSAIRCPTLAVTFEHDHIVPKESAQILLEKIGTDVRKLLHLNGGHVGAVVSRRAREGLWRALSEWFILHGKTGSRYGLKVIENT